MRGYSKDKRWRNRESLELFNMNKAHFESLLLRAIGSEANPKNLTAPQLNALRSAIVSLGTKVKFLTADKLRSLLETSNEAPPLGRRTKKDVALLVVELLDNCQQFTDVAGDLLPDDSGVMTFECDGARYELHVGPISPEREAEVYGNKV